MNNTADSTSCKIEVAKKNKDASVCNKMDIWDKEHCYYEVALEKEDKWLCAKTSQKEECEKQVTKKIAQRKLSPRLCYKLEEDYDDFYEAADCIAYVASQKKDETLCEGLPAGFGRVQNECYARVGMSEKDLSLCEKAISSPLDNQCYKFILENSSNPVQLCQELSGLSFTYCVNNINCDLSNDKELCIDFVNKTKNDPNFCEYQLNDAESTSCYTRIALKLRTPELCFKTEIKPCISKLAIETENPAICEIGVLYDAAGNCYKNYAEAYKDYKFCNRINDDFQKGQCLHDLAITLGNVEICYEINNVKREECFWYFADYLNDPSLCEYSFKDSKEDCLKRID